MENRQVAIAFVMFFIFSLMGFYLTAFLFIAFAVCLYEDPEWISGEGWEATLDAFEDPTCVFDEFFLKDRFKKKEHLSRLNKISKILIFLKNPINSFLQKIKFNRILKSQNFSKKEIKEIKGNLKVFKFKKFLIWKKKFQSKINDNDNDNDS